MSFTIDGTELGPIIEIASIVGTVASALIVALIVYLLVRPPRHIRQRRKAEERGELLRDERDDCEAEDLWRVADRMEARLEVLERALSDEIDRPAIGRREYETDHNYAPAGEGRVSQED